MKTWAEGNYCVVCYYSWDEYEDFNTICEEHKKEKEKMEKKNEDRKKSDL